MTTDEIVLDQKAIEAVHAARDAAQAVETIRQIQIIRLADEASKKAAEIASNRVEEKLIDEQRMSEIVKTQVENVLAKGTEQDRAIILARVPYICQDIKKTDGRLENIEKSVDQLTESLATFPLIQKLVFGLVGAILTGVFGVAGWTIFMVIQHS